MIYREWFVNFRFPGHEKVKMVESELGQIPEGWSVSGVTVVSGDCARGSRTGGLVTARAASLFDGSSRTWKRKQLVRSEIRGTIA